MAAKKKTKKSSSSSTREEQTAGEELEETSTVETLPRIEGDPRAELSGEDGEGETTTPSSLMREDSEEGKGEEEEEAAEIPRPKKKTGTKKSRVVSTPSRHSDITSIDPTLLGAGAGAIGLIAYFLWTKMQKRRAKSSSSAADEEGRDMDGGGGNARDPGSTGSDGIGKASDSDFYASLNKAAKSGGIEGTGENAPVGASNLPPGLRMFTTMDSAPGPARPHPSVG